MNKQELLVKEIEDSKTYFKTENYSMSIGELTNLYKDNEITIRPEYQRLFRWSHGQKVKLIESILMGIPLPTIFVYQDKDGKWELVDGLQRISTILQFMNELKETSNTDGEEALDATQSNKVEELVLQGTKYIPSFEGFSWNNVNQDLRIPESVKLTFRRSKLNITIILSESDSKAKFEVFQRLNTGGSNASNQEVRNNVMIMTNPERYKWFNGLSQNNEFLGSISLSERLIEQQYHMELLLRFIALTTQSEIYIKKDLADYLDDVNIEILKPEFDIKKAEEIFTKTFKIINDTLQEKAFKKDGKGRFLESGFEAVAIGLALNIDQYDTENDLEIVRSKIEDLYNQDFYINNAGSGSTARNRMNKIIPASKIYFDKNA